MPFSPKVARPWANGYFELVLDGVECGIVNNFGGLDISADTAKIPQSTLYLIKNQLTGNLKFADADLQCGLSMGLPFKDWVKASLDSAHVYKNGEMRVADYNRKVVQAREFTNALITEVGFPKCDANGKDVAFLNVKFAVEQTKYKAGDGATVQKPNSTNQTMFTPTNFRLTIDGLEDTCAKVSTVEALTVKQKVQRDNVGPLKIYDLIPTGLEA